MAKRRTSVELHPDGCRLVEVQISPSGRRTPVAPDARVRAFLTSVPGAQDPTTLPDVLGRLRQEQKLSRDAWVTLWGMRATHQLLRLPPAAADALEPIARREARKEIAPFDAEGTPASVAVVPGAEVLVGSNRRREVSLVAVSSADVQSRIQPIVDAGFIVRGVTTPALALAALAKSRRDATGTVAYVAIIGRATCLAIIRNGVLLFAREMPWGHEQGLGIRDQGLGIGDQGLGTVVANPESRIPNPDSVQTRLASEIKRSILFFKQTFRAPVEAVALCGDMPNLRSLTGPLGEALAVPVQTLDSLVGIDASAVPEPAEMFRSSVASLRLAIATGADPEPAANLLPKTILQTRQARQEVVRIAVAVAAGLLLVTGWYSVARATATSQRAEQQAIERELGILEPDALRQAELREVYTLTTSRQAALAAFDSQGPRLARLLEVLAASTPEAIVLDRVEVQAAGAFWRATIRGIAVSADPATAQGAVNTLLQGLADSPFAGIPIQPPSRRVVSTRGSSILSSAIGTSNGARSAQVPPGMTGVEFAMQLRLAK